MTERIINLGKALRKRPTNAEQLLWNHLRMKQIEGLKFRRQQPIDNYIVDFICFENRIIIEVDGGQHIENNKDKERDLYLQRNGFRVLRFWNNEVLQNISGVLEVIRENCLSHPPLNPLPSREGKIDEKVPPVKGGENYPLEIRRNLNRGLLTVDCGLWTMDYGLKERHRGAEERKCGSDCGGGRK